MVISKISKQKKNSKRYNIYIERQGRDEFAFGVHEDLLVRYELRKGMDLSEAKMAEIKEQDAMYKYYTLSINYLSYRMRAKSEIVKYLEKKEATDEEIAFVIERLERENLVDDLAFSEAYVRTKMNTSSNGPNRIRQELYQKHISEAMVEQALKYYTQEKEIEKLVKLIEKKLTATRKKSFQEQINQLKQSLLQKGFSYESIEIALESIDPGVNEEEEMQALTYQGEKAWRRYARKHEGYELSQKVKASLYQKGFQSDLINQFIEEKEMEEE
ncbi:recombination regulator RecX [Alkalibacillus aidingensis]|uniref:recombination regulator RecX n=1 Tax=Alkalibacillus aidingensis TaxID=2747607 RepID=UPI00166188AE|nr:recombination regulator RecX [Alkalibacillus aidingensis]